MLCQPQIKGGVAAEAQLDNMSNLCYDGRNRSNIISMCKLGELSKFLDYSSNVLEISSQLIWNIPVTYWKFPVGSKMILLFLDMFEAFKNSEKNRISLFHVSLPILTIKPSIYKGFSKLERIIIMVLCIFK